MLSTAGMRRSASASRRSRAVAASRPSSIQSQDPAFLTTLRCSHPAARSSFTGRCKAPLDLLPTPKVRKNSPAVRQFTIHTWDDLVDERRAGMQALIAMLAAGKLHPRIHDRLPLASAALAHEMLESGAVLGKLLLIP